MDKKEKVNTQSRGRKIFHCVGNTRESIHLLENTPSTKGMKIARRKSQGKKALSTNCLKGQKGGKKNYNRRGIP